MKGLNVFNYILIVAGLLGLSVGGFLHYKKNAEVDITPVHNVKPFEKKSKQTSVISLVDQHANGVTNKHRVGGTLSGHEFDKY